MPSTDLRLWAWIGLWQRHRTIEHGMTLVCPQRTAEGITLHPLSAPAPTRIQCPNCGRLLDHPQSVTDSPGDVAWPL